jgi:transposase
MLMSAALYPKVTIGVDLGDRISRTCEVDAAGRVVRRDSVATAQGGMTAYFEGRERCRVVVEAGTHSAWVSWQLEGLGHEVVVSNPSEVYGPRRRKKRNDDSDAEFLARMGRADVALLHPIRHRGPEAQADLGLIRARDQVVGARTKLINHVRGSVKSMGFRLRVRSAEAFARHARTELPGELRVALAPLLDLIEALTDRIRGHDREIERLVAERYPEAAHLRQIPGVGPLTALAFVLLVEDPARFEMSREVGAYFGLVPRLDSSGSSEPQLRITKAGDELGRRLLVSAAHYIIGPFGPDCDLRRHGSRIAERGGKNAKKRAAVAVARKLAVMMHRLWVSGAEYDPDYLARRRSA